jgi:2-iminobutanoate/2-iminopropanoate deaminase
VKRQVISTAQGPRTGLPYSQAIRHGDLVFVAGQVALDPATGQVVEGDIRAQTRQTLENIQAILRAAGTSLAHSVECFCLLSNVGDFAAFNEVYKGFFPTDPPARTTVQAVLPRPGLLVEIRTVAAMPPRAARRRGAARPARRAPAKRRRR